MKEYGETDLPGTEWQRDDDADDNKAVPKADSVWGLGRAIVAPARPEHLPPHPMEQRIVDDQFERILLAEQHGNDHCQQVETHLFDRPLPCGEEPMGS